MQRKCLLQPCKPKAESAAKTNIIIARVLLLQSPFKFPFVPPRTGVTKDVAGGVRNSIGRENSPCLQKAKRLFHDDFLFSFQVNEGPFLTGMALFKPQIKSGQIRRFVSFLCPYCSEIILKIILQLVKTVNWMWCTFYYNKKKNLPCSATEVGRKVLHPRQTRCYEILPPSAWHAHFQNQTQFITLRKIPFQGGKIYCFFKNPFSIKVPPFPKTKT